VRTHQHFMASSLLPKGRLLIKIVSIVCISHSTRYEGSSYIYSINGNATCICIYM